MGPNPMTNSAWIPPQVYDFLAKIPPFALRLLVALAIFSAGFFAARIAKRSIKRFAGHGKTDRTVSLFAAHFAYVAILVVVSSIALGTLGVQTGSIIALLGAAGLAIGLALQSSLSNLASGFLLIAYTPFKVGDFIEGAGISGTVVEIKLFVTVVNTFDNRKVTIPNSKLTDDHIINYSVLPTRRVDITVSVAYSSDLAKVKETLLSVLSEDPRVLRDPAPTVGVLNLADSGIDMAVRPWVARQDYWPVFFSLQEAIKNRFDAEGIEIPFPQRVVHLAK